MENINYEAAIEAILFTMGESVSLDKIAAALELDKKIARKYVENLMERYQAEEHGVMIMELEDSFQMCTKNEMYESSDPNRGSSPRSGVLTDVLLEHVVYYRI